MTQTNQTASSANGLVYRYYAKTGGWRFVVLFHKGRKWLRVLETARLDVHTLKVGELQTLRPSSDVTPKQLAKRIRSRRARFKRLDLNFPKRAVAKAIAVLEAC